jgi:alpha-amylase
MKRFIYIVLITLVISALISCTPIKQEVATPSRQIIAAQTGQGTATPTDIPPNATLAPAPTSAVSMLMPGDNIGQMTVEISPSFTPNLLDYCDPAFSDKPGGETVDCTMPLLPEFEIGQIWYATEATLLDSSWEALTWELYVDGHSVNLDAFGTFDVDVYTEDGTPITGRMWNLKLVNATAGGHTLRYLYRVNQEVDDGFSVIKPGTWESVLNLTLEPQEMSLPATPVLTPPLAQEAWWNNTVFYEVFVRSFADATTGPLANDGIGDLQGLIEKLDYLNDGNPTTTNDLGVTGIWLMPIMSSPSYHGYDVTDYYAVNKDYGTNEDFKQLVTEAHRRGIKIIIDLVLNHTSSEHPWFVEARDNPESERRDWYLWSEEKPSYIGPWGQEVWHPSPSGYYYGLFWSGMPDLNHENPQVTTEMENVARFWLEDAGVDGFRLDAARHMIEEGSIQENTEATHEWWKSFHNVYKASNPEALAVGEIWSKGSEVVAYLQGDELDLAFDFDLAEAILNGVMARNAGRIQEALASSYALFGSGLSATFLTNHDMNRVMSQPAMDVAKAKLAASVLMTAPGVPFVYYGEEIGMIGKKPDELIRSPMQWSAEDNAGFTTGSPWESANGDYKEKNVAIQSMDPTSLLSWYRELIHIRADHSALRVGDYDPVESKDNALLTFLRVGQEDIVLVIINLNEEAASDYDLALKEGSLAGTYQAILLYGGEAELPHLVANDNGGFDYYRPLSEIPGGGTVIIQLQPIK